MKALVRKSCPLCASEQVVELASARDMEMFSVPEAYSYMLCQACNAIYINPVPVGRLSEIYPDTYYSNEGPDTGSILERVKSALDRRQFKKILAKISEDRLSVLDVGGGGGWVLNTVKDSDSRVAETAVVDINKKIGSNRRVVRPSLLLLTY